MRKGVFGFGGVTGVNCPGRLPAPWEKAKGLGQFSEQVRLNAEQASRLHAAQAVTAR